MQNEIHFDKSYASEQLRRSTHPIRKIIKRIYLENILTDIRGATLDIGCGAGQLLERLPEGSLGLEVNPHLVSALTDMGMSVMHYDLEADDFGLTPIPVARFETIVLSHVLEHFSDAATVMKKLFRAAGRLGVSRFIIVLPGEKGFASDETHRTFIDRNYILDNDLESVDGYVLTKHRDFPFPKAWCGKFYKYQELKLVYDNLT